MQLLIYFTHFLWKLKLTNLNASCLQERAQVSEGTGGGKSSLHFILYLLNFESCEWIIYLKVNLKKKL